MRIRQMPVGFAVGLVLIASSVLASTGTDGVQTILLADDLAVVANGEKIYQARCAACHGVQLDGQPNWRQRNAQGLLPAPPHDASGHTWHHADDLLFEITKYGPGVVIADTDYRSDMPVYADILSDEDIVAVLSFIKNTWPDNERQWQEEVNGTQIDSQLPKNKGSTLLDRLLK
ncbi:MAG: mono/diheme cytochrome c family protein [Granulosicoccus sp.]|jgi:mono/diheme cytochrome c family protein